MNLIWGVTGLLLMLLYVMAYFVFVWCLKAED